MRDAIEDIFDWSVIMVIFMIILLWVVLDINRLLYTAWEMFVVGY